LRMVAWTGAGLASSFLPMNLRLSEGTGRSRRMRSSSVRSRSCSSEDRASGDALLPPAQRFRIGAAGGTPTVADNADPPGSGGDRVALSNSATSRTCATASDIGRCVGDAIRRSGLRFENREEQLMAEPHDRYGKSGGHIVPPTSGVRRPRSRTRLSARSSSAPRLSLLRSSRRNEVIDGPVAALIVVPTRVGAIAGEIFAGSRASEEGLDPTSKCS